LSPDPEAGGDIGNQIIRILDSHGQAHQIVGAPLTDANFSGKLR